MKLVLQCVAGCCIVLHCGCDLPSVGNPCDAMCCRVLQGVSVCCRVLLCVVVCGGVCDLSSV